MRLGGQFSNAVLPVTLLIVPRTVLTIVGVSGPAILLTERWTILPLGRVLRHLCRPSVIAEKRHEFLSPKKPLPTPTPQILAPNHN